MLFKSGPSPFQTEEVLVLSPKEVILKPPDPASPCQALDLLRREFCGAGGKWITGVELDYGLSSGIYPCCRSARSRMNDFRVSWISPQKAAVSTVSTAVVLMRKMRSLPVAHPCIGLPIVLFKISWAFDIIYIYYVIYMLYNHYTHVFAFSVWSTEAASLRHFRS